jgi:hypothetical protein
MKISHSKNACLCTRLQSRAVFNKILGAHQAAPEVRVRKTAQKYSGAPAQVLHEKVERAERVEGYIPHLVHMLIYQHIYVLVCSNIINNT